MEKKLNFALSVFACICLLLFSGCVSTITHYDKEGKVTKIEKVTNFSRIADGTNAKSQMILIEGTSFSSDISATNAETYTPGWKLKFANGKAAIINAKDYKDKFTWLADVVEKFFSKYEITKDGMKQ